LAADGDAWLEAEGLTKRYGGVLALDDASLRVRAGEVRGLVGANGAGKSTLIKCLTGMVAPTAGEVRIDGEPLALGRPAESLRAGIVSVPQELTVAPTLTVAQNVMLGHEPSGPLGTLRDRALRASAAEVLDSLFFDIPVDELVGRLPLIQQRLVMIARAFSFAARLVVLDEPTATLSPSEAQLLLDSIKPLIARGVSVLYVSHHLSEVEAVCDAVTVLRDGRLLAELEGSEATHARLVELLAPAAEPRRAADGGQIGGDEVVLVAESLVGERLRDVSMVVHRAEIVGLAGLAGSGARELLLTLCGAVPFRSGSIAVAGRRLRSGRSPQAVAAGVGFLPGDRSLGTFPSHSVRHNVSLAALRDHAWGPIVDKGSERSAVAALLDRVGLRADGETAVSSLSGGSQQKALVARWIASGARLLLLDDPTAGVDVATRPEIHAEIRSLAAAGAGVLLASTDVEELAELADRVVVFDRGAVTGELEKSKLTAGRVLAAMTGGESAALTKEA
jgi:monosaccharide-transporting ATPase